MTVVLYHYLARLTVYTGWQIFWFDDCRRPFRAHKSDENRELKSEVGSIRSCSSDPPFLSHERTRRASAVDTGQQKRDREKTRDCRLQCISRSALVPENATQRLMRMVLRLLIVILCALLSSGGRIFLGAQSFVLVPWFLQQQNYYPHSSSAAHRKGCYIICGRTTALFVRRKNSGDPNPAFAINKRLVELGKRKQWRELLEVTEQEQANFNNVNYATVMSQLGRIWSLDRSDPRFLAFLRALATIDPRAGTAVDTSKISCQHCPRHWQDEIEESEYQENTGVDFKA